MTTDKKTPTVKHLTPDRDGKPIIVVVAAPTKPKQKPDTSQER